MLLLQLSTFVRLAALSFVVLQASALPLERVESTTQPVTRSLHPVGNPSSLYARSRSQRTPSRQNSDGSVAHASFLEGVKTPTEQSHGSGVVTDEAGLDQALKQIVNNKRKKESMFGRLKTWVENKIGGKKVPKTSTSKPSEIIRSKGLPPRGQQRSASAKVKQVPKARAATTPRSPQQKKQVRTQAKAGAKQTGQSKRVPPANQRAGQLKRAIGGGTKAKQVPNQAKRPAQRPRANQAKQRPAQPKPRAAAQRSQPQRPAAKKAGGRK